MFKLNPSTTRVDIERVGDALTVQQWTQGWKEGNPSDHKDLLHGERIVSILFSLEKQGFSVWMMDEDHGRALRGEITRIDLIDLNGKTTYSKFPYGWTARTHPISKRTISAEERKQIILWCQEHNWVVREWPGGARAWKYALEPVRSASEIRSMRRQVEDLAHRYGEAKLHFFDLAYDG